MKEGDPEVLFLKPQGALQFIRAAVRTPQSWPELRRIYEHDVLPAWWHRRVQDLTRREIRDLVEQKAKTAPVMANRLLARISRLFSFALERDWIEAHKRCFNKADG